MTAETITPSVDQTQTDRRRLLAAARAGLRDIVPMVVGVAPFGLAIGATLATTSLSFGAGMFSAAAILAGAAQLTTVTMLEEGAAPLVIVLSALIINARIVLYSAAVAPWFAEERWTRRLVLAIPIIDQMYLTCVPRFARGDLDRRERQAYWLAAGAFLITGFLSTQALAMVAGARLPAWTGIEVAAPLALTGLLARSTADRPSIQAALAAGAVVVLGAGLPYQTSILAAIAAGLVAGMARTTTSKEVAS